MLGRVRRLENDLSSVVLRFVLPTKPPTTFSSLSPVLGRPRPCAPSPPAPSLPSLCRCRCPSVRLTLNGERRDAGVFRGRIPREGDDISDVVDPCGEEDQTFEAKPKASVRHSAVLAQLKVPPVRCKVHARLLDRIHENLNCRGAGGRRSERQTERQTEREGG